MCLLALARAGAPEEAGEWAFRAPVIPAPEGKGALIEFPLIPEVFDRARADLGDLRIFTDGGDEVPYVFRMARGKVSSGRLPMKLLNRTYVPGKYSRVVVDFRSRTLKNRIDVITAGENFRRKVIVEGSDDGRKFRRIIEGAFIFRIGRKGEGGDKNDIEITDNNQRFLQVTVFNGQDDPPKVEIEDVQVWRRFESPPQTEQVAIRSAEAKEHKGFTEIVIDLGSRKLPLYDLTLQFAGKDFWRQAVISGTDEDAPDDGEAARGRTGESVSGASDAGGAKDRSWTQLAALPLYRFSSGGAKEEQLTVPLQSRGFRYIQVRIDNGADKPLRFKGASAKRVMCFVSYRPTGLGSSWLYFGNEKSASPRYDLTHFVDRLRGEGVRTATLGSPVPLEPGKGGAPVPWSKKYQALIWAALLAAFTVIALLIHRQIKSASAS
jgi:hypothetical protein